METKYANRPLIALTPLYQFRSDVNEIALGDRFMALKYSQESFLRFAPDDIFLKHLQICPPDYILWQLPSVDVENALHRDGLAAAIGQSNTVEELLQEAVEDAFHFPAVKLFWQLRLFKPGRLFAGETFIVNLGVGNDHWETQISRRASMMSIDYVTLPHESETFSIASAELPFFAAFANALEPLMDSLRDPNAPFAQLQMALVLFGRHEGMDGDLLYALTALEGLLVSDSKSELAYRLSLRVANLLGTDGDSRKRIFRDMKDFYNLRSSIVHGAGFRLKAKEFARLKQVPVLREHLRRSLLSIVALLSEGLSQSEIEDLLDDVLLDAEVRERVQKISAKYLYLNPTPP
jgi:hypothetical protein